VPAGAVVVLEVALGVLRISKRVKKSSSRTSAFTAIYITISKSLGGKRDL